METYAFLQHYWWFIISLLGGLLVFLLFVQGGQSFIFSAGKTPLHRGIIVNSAGRKWEFTFTTLVTFGGAFFASFPLFYSTSFGGAYWVWMLILLVFVLQAFSYEYQHKKGNVLGSKTYQTFLFLNGVLAPILLGTAVATFFTGANFTVDRDAVTALGGTTTVSVWQPYNGVQLHGLEAVLNLWNVLFGICVLFLARTTALLYFINNVTEPELNGVFRKRLLANAAIFVVTFLAFVGYVLVKDGFAVNPETGEVFMEPYKYLHNLLAMPYLLAGILVGVVLVLFGVIKTLLKKDWTKGIWYHGVGVVLTVTCIFLMLGWGHTSYYPSVADLQSSLTIQNSSSSLFTLRTMAYVSILVPFVLAYIFYAWRKIDFHKFDKDELTRGNAY